jgi:hypothetical protein
MSMGEYYEDMTEQTDRDNEMDRLEKIAQAKILEDKIKKLIQQQSKIIIDVAIAARDKEWWTWLNKIAYKRAFPQNKESDWYGEFYCISSKDLQERKKSLGESYERL